MRNDQTRRSGRVRQVLLGTARWGGLGLVGLLALGAAYHAVATTLDSGRFSAPGRLVEVDGRRMHIHCTGQGQPTVILDAGNAGVTSTWGWIQPDLARHTRVCAYDRAGLGWSESGKPSRDAVTVVHELKALLDATGEPGPYIHVGHSLGGIYGRVFAAEFPDDVVGLGLVDASHPEQFGRFPEEIQRQMAIYERVMRLAPFAAAVGFVRITNVYGRMAEGLPEEDYRRAVAMVARTGHVRTSNAEIAAWDANAARLADETDLGDLPLVVITAGSAPDTPDGFMETHQANQRELAALSIRGRHEVLGEADHLSVLMREGHAARAADVLRALVDTVRADMGWEDRLSEALRGSSRLWTVRSTGAGSMASGQPTARRWAMGGRSHHESQFIPEGSGTRRRETQRPRPARYGTGARAAFGKDVLAYSGPDRVPLNCQHEVSPLAHRTFVTMVQIQAANPADQLLTIAFVRAGTVVGELDP
jgi:pimeloyl-ACP methyl ester carboxylesterase